MQRSNGIILALFKVESSIEVLRQKNPQTLVILRRWRSVFNEMAKRPLGCSWHSSSLKCGITQAMERAISPKNKPHPPCRLP